MSVRRICFGFVVLLEAAMVLAGVTNGGVNLTDFVRHRQRRFLIFENGGIIKLNTGVTLPILFGDPIAWRGMVCTYNLQGGHYTVPTEPLYPWDKWEDIFARSMRRMESRMSNFGNQLWQDDARQFVYTGLETYMDRKNGNGRACLLRSICENAQVDHHVGVLAEIINVVLTPGRAALHSVYAQARTAGESGVNCLQLYHECPSGANLLDQLLADF